MKLYQIAFFMNNKTQHVIQARYDSIEEAIHETNRKVSGYELIPISLMNSSNMMLINPKNISEVKIVEVK